MTLKKIFFTEKELKESMNDSCKEIIKKIATLKKLWPFLRADFFAFPPCSTLIDVLFAFNNIFKNEKKMTKNCIIITLKRQSRGNVKHLNVLAVLDQTY